MSLSTVIAAILISQMPNSYSPISYRQIARTFSARKFKSSFGMSVFEFESIHTALKLPSPIWTGSENLWDSKTALLVYVAWLRGLDFDILEERFGWSKGRCLRIMKTLKRHIFRQWSHLLDLRCADNHIFSPRRLDYYEAAWRRETGVPDYWGSTDAGVHPTNERLPYERWAHVDYFYSDCWKVEAVVTPDGLTWLRGPYNGFTDDAHVEAETSLANWAEENAKSQDGRQLRLCGIQRYGMSPAIVSPIHDYKLPEEQRKSLEKNLDRFDWSISMVPRHWRHFRDYLFQQEGGNEISKTMGCNPPSLFEYFSHRNGPIPWVLPNPEHRDTGINVNIAK